MARRNNKSPDSGQRDLYNLITRPVRLAAPLRLSSIVSPLVEDRRLFNPLGDYRPPLSTVGTRVSLTPAIPKASPKRSTVPVGIAFSQPEEVNICRRRKTRREVIFAKKLQRKGASGSRRRNMWSDVSC